MPSSGRQRSEYRLERALCDAVKASGGECVKLPAAFHVGIPDRLVLLPGFAGFAELKKDPTSKVTKRQLWWERRLRALDLPYIRSHDLDEILAWCGLLPLEQAIGAGVDLDQLPPDRAADRGE